MTDDSPTFTPNRYPTIGVEIELQLVDADSMALVNAFPKIRAGLPESLHESVKPELMKSYLEINTGVCRTVGEVERDLTSKIRAVESIAAGHNIRLCWAGTHPFSRWKDQILSDNPRYRELMELMQDPIRRLVTFGLHVHVGVDSGDKAIMICDRLMRHLPSLLALSANSPFWQARDTGLASQRSKVMEGLPTAGLPPMMRNWSEYVWLLRTLVETNFVRTVREIWWDVRPHHNFGTVEVRICDMPPDLRSTLAIVALVQCLVHALSERIDQGTYQLDYHPMMVRQNKWRACRYGLWALLVDPYTQNTSPAPQVIKDLVSKLRDNAIELKCRDYLEDVARLADEPNGAIRQRRVYEQTRSWEEVVRQLVQASALS